MADRLSQALIEQIAAALLEAERELRPILPLTTSWPELDLDGAYAVQVEVIKAKLAAGRRIAGRKVGLTSRVMQQMMGVDEPDYGVLLDDMVLENDCKIDCGAMIAPKAEAEIAFVLERELKGPGVTAEDVLDATKWVVPVLEIIDSRIENWKIKLADTVADNASSGRVVVGAAKHRPAGLNLAAIGMVMEKNGERVASGSGDAVLGNPANAVAWLANKLDTVGERLRAGDLVIPGSLCAAIGMGRGDRVRAKFDLLGVVEAQFV